MHTAHRTLHTAYQSIHAGCYINLCSENRIPNIIAIDQPRTLVFCPVYYYILWAPCSQSAIFFSWNFQQWFAQHKRIRHTYLFSTTIEFIIIHLHIQITGQWKSICEIIVPTPRTQNSEIKCCVKIWKNWTKWTERVYLHITRRAENKYLNEPISFRLSEWANE